jgi:HK97 family phage prohead protease
MTPLIDAAATTGMLPRKTLDCQFKAISDDGSFVLYAACFGNIDRQGDIIERGAFDNLEEFVKAGWIALNHDQAGTPVGYPTEAVQDERGLKVSGKFHSTPKGQECRTIAKERMEAGKLVPCSIGYVCKDESYEKQDGAMIRRIKKLSVYEASFVNLPANPEAAVVDAKTIEAEPQGDDMDKETDKAGAALLALKELLSELQTKSDAKPMSKAGMTRLKAFAEAMHEHGEGTREHAKAMTEHGKAACAMAKEMHKFLKGYKDDEDGDGDGEEEMERDEEGDVQERRKSRKEAEPEDTADGEPPKGRKRREDEDKTAYREILRRRALTGRVAELCP